MAKTTNWINATDTDWNVAGNWDNGVPVDTDTVGFLDGTKTLPATNLPNASEVFVLVIDGESAGTKWDKSLTDFCGTGTYSYSSLTIGDAAGRNNDEIVIDKDSAVAGTATLYGEVTVGCNLPNLIITIFGTLYSATYTIAQSVIVSANADLTALAGATVSLSAAPALAGTITVYGPGCTFDIAAPVNVTAATAAVEWGFGSVIIKGGFNANGHAVTHYDSVGGLLVCDVTGALELGGAATGLNVQITDNATVTVADAAMSVRTIRIEAGSTLDFNTNGLTLASGRIHGYGTLTGLVPAGIIHVAPGVVDGGSNHANVVFDPTPMPLVI